jgi:uncharacterized protein (DUF2062 family)
MPRRLIKRYMPDPETIRNHRHLRIFGTLLHDANLWHLNRHSVSTAFAIGLFWGFIPMPFQMIPAALLAIVFRANLPISVALVWVSNPVTMPPLFYFCYKVGTWILRLPPKPFHFELSWAWLGSGLLDIWQPFLLGCVVVGGIASLLGYVSMRTFWRWHVARNWQRRKERRQRHDPVS